MRKLSALLLVLAGVSASVFGQKADGEKPPELPPGPLILADAGDFAQWTISVTQLKPKEKPAALTDTAPPQPVRESLLRLVITKTKPVTRVQTLDGNRILEDRWIIGRSQVIAAPNMKTPYVVAGAHAEEMLYPTKDFSEFSWISPKNFKGIEKVSGRDCICFKDTVTIQLEDQVEQYVAAAYIDVETRLPIVLQKGIQSRVYQFGVAPQTLQPVPPDVQAQLDLVSQNNAALRRVPARP